MPSIKDMSDDALWERLEISENDFMVARLELTARAMGHHVGQGEPNLPVLMKQSRLAHLSKQFQKPGEIEELKQRVEALSRSVDHHLGDDVGDGLANKIKDLLIAANAVVRLYNKDP